MCQRELPGDCQVVQKLETTLQPFIGLGFPLTCMENVDHDGVWRASLNEVRQRRAHAPNCSKLNAHVSARTLDGDEDVRKECAQRFPSALKHHQFRDDFCMI